ncbi:DNA alkylation repair protein [Candidatus Woesearchaeota archaeon]|jgi:3-methyladenine DNA glycosylase AlkD|nr:DNA alkylation repair protein [Candidatus Woesearchaeota archaeon]MBT5272795.1 DNA alkylation repair protein [Candidatus Woesearchaeota archaeon]MBT6040407.1 DNA alkylation repair protein [Candidatus Woesearchaeota archaeon]MBT6336960.1 DNA alkylation repair protein [Candidatus Woesearchaeota archaeon]MBT7926846.1 DNA alkylation repair protein [Candidatus Woesearchaeota archaeon]
MLNNYIKELKKAGNPEKARILQGFFKTGKGEYGEGDVFLGITVPKQREIAKKYVDLEIKDLQTLLNSKIHEHRLGALFILIMQYQKAAKIADKKESEKIKTKIVKSYLKNTKKINNWDLVDISAPKILGDFLLNKDRNILYKLAKSKNLWEKRISMLATYAFIRENQFDDTLKISEILVRDDHDLIHKAVGWMLREIGKKDQAVEEKFLKKYYKTMPRTMLRYAIERFDEKKRKYYMKK